MFIGLVATSVLSTYARNNTTCGLLINGFHGFPSLAFFLNHSDKNLRVWDLFHMCCQVAMPLCSVSTFKTWLCLCVPLLSSPPQGSSSSWCLPHVSPLALLSSARVLQDGNWLYTGDICSSRCVGWEEHPFSLVMVGSKYLKGFYFFLPQVLVVPMLSNIPYLAMVFHSSTSGVDSDS